MCYILSGRWEYLCRVIQGLFELQLRMRLPDRWEYPYRILLGIFELRFRMHLSRRSLMAAVSPNIPLLSPEAQIKRLKAMEATHDLTLWLSDTQTVSGLAYLTAAISQGCSTRKLDILHMCFLQGIVWLPVQSHQLALDYAFDSHPPGYLALRICGMLAFLALFITFQGLIMWRVIKSNLPSSDEFCYVSVPQTSMIAWSAANIVFVSATYTPLITRLKMFDFRLSIYLSPPLSYIKRACWDLTGLWLLWRIFVSPEVNLLSFIYWYVSTLEDSCSVRSDYRQLLSDTAEDQWGFGQILAMVFLLGIVLELYKSWTSTFPLPHPLVHRLNMTQSSPSCALESCPAKIRKKFKHRKRYHPRHKKLYSV